MHQIVQLVYIVAIIAGVTCFAMQALTAAKNLSVSNSMVKSKSASVFFALIAIFNVCDFLIIFLGDQIGKESISWIFILENVLEVALAYALIAMEGDYARAQRKRWVTVLFASVAAVILWLDAFYTAEIIPMSEHAYMAVMIGLNLIPLAVAAYLCFGYMKKILSEPKCKVIDGYLIVYNAVFIFLCIVVTVSIIDSRTTWDYIKNDKEFYAMFWLIFNALNVVLIWTSCGIVGGGKKEEAESVKERVERICAQYNLSGREKEIALLLYKGKNNSEIAEALFLSTNTVKVHTSNIYRKMGVTSRLQAVRAMRDEAGEE